MASASVVDRLRLEALPFIDLRLLSQPDLYTLSLCSSSSSSSSSSYDNDDVLIPKIDRSVFNESAGSRKQTYSRLRLAPRKPQSHSTPTPTRSSFSYFPRQIPEPLDEENSQIISLLKQLFAAETSPTADDDGLVSVPVEFEESLPDSSSAGLQIVPVDVVSCGRGEENRKQGRPPKNENRMIERKVERKAEPNIPINVVVSEREKKRKRGRPRKNENLLIESGKSEREMAAVYESVEEKKEMEMVVVNKKGDVAGVAALGNVEDPYGEELKRRTEGLQTEAEFLGFLSGLSGEWWRKSRKKRIVMASDFGHALPNGWKLMLSIKKRAGRVWLHCRRYISPNGRQFVSCKEVSSYFLSSFGLQDASQPRSGHTDENIRLGRKMDFRDDTLMTGDPKVQTGEILKCLKCTMLFDEKNDLVHHLVSSHSNTANSCKYSTSLSDGVIIKDGKYECQLCHKIFDERHHYNGHIGIHARDYVKSVEASGVINTQKSVDPDPTGVLPSSSKVHESIGIDWTETSSIEAIGELSSGFSCNIIKADTDIETCSDRDSHVLVLLSHDKETIKADKDDHALVEEHGDKQDNICNMTNDNLGKVNVVSVVANSNARSVNEIASNNENKSICDSYDESNVLKCISRGINNCVAEVRGSETWWLAPPGNERTFVVENNVINPSVEEQKLEISSESGLKGKDKTCSGEDIEVKCFTSTVEDMKVDGGYTFENSESVSGFGNHDSGLKDVCTNVNISGNDVITVGFGNNYASQNDKAVTSSKQEGSSGSCLVISSWNEQYVVENNANKSSYCTVEGPFQGKEFKNHEFASSIIEQRSGFDNDITEVSTGAVEGLKPDDVRNCKLRELNISFDRNETEVDAGTTACSVQERGFKGSLLVSSAEDRYGGLKNNIYNSTVEELKQVTGLSENGLRNQFGCEQSHDNMNNVNKVSCGSIEEAKKVKSFWNTEVFVAFGTQGGIDADATSTVQGQSFEGCSLVSENKQTFSTNNKVTGVYSSTVGELKHERGSENSFLCSSAFDQIENKLNRVSMSTVREQPRSEEMERPRDDELMIDFGNQAQSNEDVMAEFLWRTKEQNVEQSGLANTSSPFLHSSGCFPNFNLMSTKGGEKNFRANERFDSESGLEGLRSSSTGNLEYNFLTSQASSHPEESKVLSNDAAMEQGFNSTDWLKNDFLPSLPKVANRHQVRTTCVWCTNEFYLESVNSGMHSDSVGFMCATCNAKFSGQFNIL